MYIPLFILSLPALRCHSSMHAVHEYTAILKFNIKPLTTSTAQHPWAFSFSRGQKGQIFYCNLKDFVKLTAVPSFSTCVLVMRHSSSVFTIEQQQKIQLKSFKLYFIKFDLIIDYTRKWQNINTFQQYPPELDKLKLSMVLDLMADPGQAAHTG